MVESQLAMTFMEKQRPLMYHPRTADNKFVSHFQDFCDKIFLALISKGHLGTFIFLLFVHYILSLTVCYEYCVNFPVKRLFLISSY